MPRYMGFIYLYRSSYTKAQGIFIWSSRNAQLLVLQINKQRKIPRNKNNQCGSQPGRKCIFRSAVLRQLVLCSYLLMDIRPCVDILIQSSSYTKAHLSQAGSIWLNMAQAGSTWFNIAQVSSTWLKLAQLGSSWLKLAQHGSTCCFHILAQVGSSWLNLAQAGSSWIQLA